MNGNGHGMELGKMALSPDELMMIVVALGVVCEIADQELSTISPEDPFYAQQQAFIRAVTELQSRFRKPLEAFRSNGGR